MRRVCQGEEAPEYLGWLLVGLLIGGGITFVAMRLGKAGVGRDSVAGLLRAHFHPTRGADIAISERGFPFRVRAFFATHANKPAIPAHRRRTGCQVTAAEISP